MIVYEVTATIDTTLADKFEQYMREKHIADVLATGAFTSADFETSEKGRYRTRYIAETQHELDHYLSEFAPGLRDRIPMDLAAHVGRGAFGGASDELGDLGVADVSIRHLRPPDLGSPFAMGSTRSALLNHAGGR